MYQAIKAHSSDAACLWAESFDPRGDHHGGGGGCGGADGHGSADGDSLRRDGQWGEHAVDTTPRTRRPSCRQSRREPRSRPSAWLRSTRRCSRGRRGSRCTPVWRRTLARRREALDTTGAIDWGHAETLAFATVLTDGTPIRLTGQDAERGTFSHRHVVLHDRAPGELRTSRCSIWRAARDSRCTTVRCRRRPCWGSSTATARRRPRRVGVVGSPVRRLRQCGAADHRSVHCADRAKWGQDSDVVLLLPHGYEGGGPEHSSARLERFLQLWPKTTWWSRTRRRQHNISTCLRRHVATPSRRPLVVMTPKSLLRLDRAASSTGRADGRHFETVHRRSRGVGSRPLVIAVRASCSARARSTTI